MEMLPVAESSIAITQSAAHAHAEDIHFSSL
jgi:hypothetical protein